MSDYERPAGVVMTTDEVLRARMAARGLKPPPAWPEPGPLPPNLPPEGIRRWRMVTEGAVAADVNLDQAPRVTTRRDMAGDVFIECAEERPLRDAARFLAGALRDSPRADLTEQRQAALSEVLDRLDKVEELRAQAAARGDK